MAGWIREDCFIGLKPERVLPTDEQIAHFLAERGYILLEVLERYPQAAVCECRDKATRRRVQLAIMDGDIIIAPTSGERV